MGNAHSVDDPVMAADRRIRRHRSVNGEVMMNVESVAHSAAFAGETTHAVHEYYHVGRVRSAAAEKVLLGVSFFVSSVMIARGVKRDELFEKYDLKLWSFDDNLTKFAISTIPSAAALGVLFVGYKLVAGLRNGF
jgi:hypothetical protein